MGIASKIVLVACLAFVPLLAVHTWLSLQREELLFRSDMERDLGVLATHLHQIAVSEWRREGPRGVASVLAAATRADSHVGVAWHPDVPGQVPRSQVPRKRGVHDEGGSLLWVEPVNIDGARIGQIVLSESLAPMRAYLRSTLVRLTALTVVLIAGGLLGARLLSHRLIGRRLDALNAFAAATGAGRLGEPLDVGGHDEISRLGASLRHMGTQLSDARRYAEDVNAERLTMLQHLRHADRLASLGRLAGSVAHELGTPLNIVMGHANRIAEGAQTAPETKESAATIHRQVKRMETTIRDILGFVRQAPGEEKLVDLNAVVENVRSLYSPLAERRQVEIQSAQTLPDAWVIGREVQIEQALSNLVSNAIDASPEPGRVEITLAAEERVPRTGGRPRTMLVARVRDQGAGVAQEDVRRLFEAFYTSKPAGHGTGLGLWLAEGIVHDHAGWIEIDDANEGACFAIVLPRAEVH